METLSAILSNLNAASPIALVAIIALSAMYFMYMIIKLFIGIIDKKGGNHE